MSTLRAGDNDSETTKELLDGMQLCSTFMSSIMNNLLDVRKIEEGKMEFRLAPVSLVKLLENAHQMMKAGVRNGVDFLIDTSKLSASRTWVNADAHRIQQVLSNVLSNAIKYTLTGSITLSVSWIKNQVQFECTDTGPGIPKSEQAKLFERFVQRGGAPGTGLGLNIAKQIVHRMSGTIEFESDPTVKPGTTCRILMPLEEIHHIPAQQKNLQQYQLPHAEATEGSSVPPSSRGPQDQVAARAADNDKLRPIQESISILIMDDIKMNRSMLKRRLQKAVAPNAEFVLVSTGEEALRVCIKKQSERNQAFDIIVCDQYMDDAGGVMLGTDTIIALRRERIDSLIIGCSGNDLSNEFIESGADIVWSKPMPSNEVIISQFRKAIPQRETRSAKGR